MMRNTPTGNQIRAARALLALNQSDLANCAGVARSTVSTIESHQGPAAPVRCAVSAAKALESLGVRFTAKGVELAA